MLPMIVTREPCHCLQTSSPLQTTAITSIAMYQGSKAELREDQQWFRPMPKQQQQRQQQWRQPQQQRQQQPAASRKQPCDRCFDLHVKLREAEEYNERARPILAGIDEERASFERRMVQMKTFIDKQKADLQELKEEGKKNKAIPAESRSQISDPKTDDKEKYWEKECYAVRDKYLEEKADAAKLKQEMLQLKCQVQEEWKEHVQRLEEQVSQRDAEVLMLRKQMAQLSQQLMETNSQLSNKDTELLQSQKLLDLCSKEKEDFSNQLSTKESELLQSQKTWQAKCDALEENLTKEMAEKDQSWEARVNLLEEENKKLVEELSSKKQKKWWHWRFLSRKANTTRRVVEGGQTEKE